MEDISLLSQLIFNSAASMVVLALCYLLSKNISAKPYIGFIYLFSIPLKGAFFYKNFPTLFDLQQALSTQGKAIILLPMLFFLVLEILFLSKILNQKPSGDI